MPTLSQPFPDFGQFLTYAQGVKSITAMQKGIRNVPTEKEYDNMVRWYNTIYEPICRKFGPLPIISFYRSPPLNRAVGGAVNSAHKGGRAGDIDCDGSKKVTNTGLIEWARKNLVFDQIIAEFPDPVTLLPRWVHIGISEVGETPRQQYLAAARRSGRVVYELLA